MTTNSSGSDDARAELDQLWAKWVADGARRDRERQTTVTRFTIVLAIVVAVVLATLLVRG